MTFLYERAMKVVRETSEVTGVTVVDILGFDRAHHVTFARKIAMWIMRVDLDMTYREIGSLLERDHSGVRYATQRLDAEQLKIANTIRQRIGVI